ncbi:MAG: beta-propeller fold lactonase family protein [Pirellulales bacterium]
MWLVLFLQLVVAACTAPCLAADAGGTPVRGYRSPNAICLSPDGRWAYVVNTTSDTVSVLDVAARKVVAEMPVGSSPADAVCAPDGRTLYVTNRHGSSVTLIDLETEQVRQSIRVAHEPYGVAVSADGRLLFVANGLSGTVSIVDLESGTTRFEVPSGREARSVAEVPGESKIVVANGLGRSVTVIDVETGRALETRDLDRGNLLREIVCSSDGRWALVSHVVSHDELAPLQMERGMIHANGFSVFDLTRRKAATKKDLQTRAHGARMLPSKTLKRSGHRVTFLLDQLLAGAANPWGMALSPDDQRLYVSLAGVHEIAIVDVAKILDLAAEANADEIKRLERDVEFLDRRKIMRRVSSGGIGPRGIALQAVRGELLVANYFSDSVAVLDATTGELRCVIPLGPTQEPTLWRRGEMLFNDGRLCFQKWFSCASCHQEDATVDGLNWDLSNDSLGNAKNVKSLHDVHDTPPAMWTAIRSGMDAAVAAGQRFLGFLPKPENHRALMTFLSSPPRPPNPYRLEDPERIQTGRQVFFRARCDACHPPSRFTDLRKHDLGLAAETDLKSRFDTPSLRDCYRTAPYLHDGRAATLREIFLQHNPNDTHGRTSRLTPDELDALLAYVRSL